ncbi:hypothetical protein RhiirA4_485853 [Rhizophagus irregularis]|uniref:Uncharacterized protein n=1 Tax=Rhizophagus irregularis TaxID=588596 RepID=A0A2I1HQN6_9GLOM|nr:hypothetical protein RhiirA4_485853 [Rhizophagus irregularis]
MKNGHNSEETYFVPSILWCSDEHVSVTPSNEPKIFRLAPKCPTSSNFLQWAIKSTSQNTLNNSMFMSEISGESIGSIAV